MTQRIPDSHVPSDFADFYKPIVEKLGTRGSYVPEFGNPRSLSELVDPSPQDVDLASNSVRQKVVSTLIH